MNHTWAKHGRLSKGDCIGGRYRVLHPVGQGGMGTVYAVSDLKLDGSIRAMKVAEGKHGVSAYSEEAGMLMRLNHPCLPHITDYFPMDEESGCFEALIMDYVDGHTLSSILEQSLMALTIADIIQIGLQLCSALLYLHEQPVPIIHRDLKPSNVMIDRNGQVKLIDFGISRRFKEGQASDTVQLGTLGFAAPEQREGKQSDARTDIYSLGMLFYYLAMRGRVMAAELQNAPLPALLKGLPKDVPAIIRSMLERMLEPNAAYRCQSMREVERGLKAAASGVAMDFSHTIAVDADGRSGNAGGNSGHGLRISVISLSPGAGATWVTLTTAMLLAKQGYSVMAAEYYKLPPEWNEWLPGVMASSSPALTWLPCSSPDTNEKKHHERMFSEGLLHSEAQIQLIDFSHAWSDPEAMSWLLQSQYVLVICDPFIAKWQPDKVKALLELEQSLCANGRELHWIANKDMKFRRRAEWLDLLPRKPLTAIPMLPQDELLELMWKRRWIIDHPRFGKQIESSLSAVSRLAARCIQGR
ncbi:serine/threonine-protein kinase [Paenibacillus sp. HB172176]|uniref:serine/threonine protein kinase n=1 Tax=Paenibacillus sp. HB172176 TaxID=2493690 RepID=UPI00143C00E9|nr:serine/threonine-protein kinase [Paenibacillus sp. HB172176]